MPGTEYANGADGESGKPIYGATSDRRETRRTTWAIADRDTFRPEIGTPPRLLLPSEKFSPILFATPDVVDFGTGKERTGGRTGKTRNATYTTAAH